MKTVLNHAGVAVSSCGTSSRKATGHGSIRSCRSRRLRVLSLAAAGIFSIAPLTYAADTADYVNLSATAALDSASNYSLNALPGSTNDMVFTNGTYSNTAFTLNTTALTPGTLGDLDATQALSITGSQSITLKTLANGISGNAADLLYVASGASLSDSTPIVLGISGGDFDVAGTSDLTGIISGSTASFTVTKTGSGILTLSGSGTYTGATGVNAGTLELDFTAPAAPVTNIVSASSVLSMSGGSLLVNGLSGSSSQTFASTTFVQGATSNITVAGGAQLALKAFTAQAGSSVVLNGPATINASGNVAATGTITTTTAGSGAVGLLNTAGNNNAYATVGLYDWASTDIATGTAGTSPYTIMGGSQITGFYTADANNTTPVSGINWDISTQEVPGAATTEARVSSASTYPSSVRFNSAHAPYINVKSGNAYLGTGGVLITPNLGSVNAAIDGLRLTNTGVQIVQNNTNAVFILGTNTGTSANTGPFFSSAPTTNTNDNVVKSGAGTFFIAPMTGNNLPQNYLNASGVLTTVNTTNYNYTNYPSTSPYALYLNGGVTVINNTNVLGNPATLGTAFGTVGTVNLNGGTLMSDLLNVSLTNIAANGNRALFIGAEGGGLAAAAGTNLTVAGFIEPNDGNGALTIGIPASAANGNVVGLVPGTGGTTANAAVNATGTVTLTAANGYSGGTILDSGTLNINGSYALGGANYGGLTFNGGTLQYAPNTTSGNGGTDVSFGRGVTVAAGGGTIDLNGNAVTWASSIGNGGTGPLNIISTDTNHAGVLTLGGNSTLTGGLNLNSGTLSVTGTLSATTPVAVNSGTMLMGNGSAGAVTVASGATITTGAASPFIGQLSMSSLVFNGGTLQFGIGTSAAGNISSGAATFNATPTISFVLSGSPASGSTYTLLTSATPIADNGYLSSLAPTTIGRLTLTPSESGNNSIIVTLTGSVGNLIWNNGASTGLWNIQTDKNFLNAASSNQDYYYEGDNVTFNDSNNGNYTVAIATTVNPGSVNVNNSGGNYIFNGPGSISGGTSLIKAGADMLTVNTANTYTGGTIVSAGTLQLGIVGALPAAGSVTVQGNGVLDLKGNNQTIGGLSDGGVSTGTITSSSGPAILTLSSTLATNAFSGLVTGNLGLNKTGGSTLTLSDSNSYTGLTNISAGTLVAADDSALGSSISTSGGLFTAGAGIVDFTTATPVIASLSGTGGSVVLANASGTTLTVGAGNQTTTFGGVLSDMSGTTSTAVGNLYLVGNCNLTLAGANTFTGMTTIGGTSTLTLGNPLALADSTLNYDNQGGVLSFGSLTAATLAGLTGSESLALNNASSAGVTLSVGNTGVSSTYSGILSGSGALTKIGTGNFTLNGSNTYTGSTLVSAGTVTVPASAAIGAGASAGSITVGAGATTLNVSGGTVTASSLYTNDNGGASTINLTNNGNINVSAGTITIGSDNGSSGTRMILASGTVTANAVAIGRSGNNYGTTIPTAASAADGIYVDGATLNVNTTLTDGFSNLTNSSATLREDAGSITVGGLTTVTNDAASRYSVIDISGGKFSGAGVQIGGAYAAPYAEFLVRGTGVVSVSGISFGNATQTGGSDVLELLGGSLYLGTNGISNGGTSITPTINLGGTAYATAPVLAASSAWSSPLGMTLTNSSGGAPAVIQTANAMGAAENISLSGNLAGTGGLTATGTGVLTLSGANSYSGPTNVSAGTLVSAVAGALPVGNNVSVALGATLVSDSQATVSSLSALNINGNMIVHGGSLQTLTQQVGQGYNYGAWNGSAGAAGVAITSSAAAADITHLHALGVIQNDDGMGTSTALYTTFEGQSVSDSDVLVKYTYYGDTNLDGKVDGSDYSRIDATYLAEATEATPFSTPVSGWFNGDFNYDGVVNGSDYTLMDNAYNSQGTQIAAEIASPTAQIAGVTGTSAVPEPATLGLLGIGAIGLLGRRSRRRH